LNSRSTYFGAYAQDSWRVRPTLTLNLGIRWDISQPWYDTKNMLSTFVPGRTVSSISERPDGHGFSPGDKGIAKTIAPTRYNNFAPRIGFAYAPASGKTSIRGGFGIFYSSIQQVQWDEHCRWTALQRVLRQSGKSPRWIHRISTGIVVIQRECGSRTLCRHRTCRLRIQTLSTLPNLSRSQVHMVSIQRMACQCWKILSCPSSAPLGRPQYLPSATFGTSGTSSDDQH